MIIGSNIMFLENLPSTNTYASNLLKKGNPQEGTIIHTNYQSAGRGQQGNKWESTNGNNLLLSIILYPSFINPSCQFVISMAISLGICDFLSGIISDCCIKWPNDIYVNNDKIAGLLIENSIMGNTIENTIVGIGLNVNQVKFISDAPNPVSLRILTENTYDIEACMINLMHDLDKRYCHLSEGNNSGLKDEYISKLYRYNEWFSFYDKNGTFSGRIKSVTDEGRIQIETKSGSVNEYSYKEVGFIP
jgi:BirA family biotin operon repressor/biotin-[acetyl-CoA-carboxylase] ligase